MDEASKQREQVSQFRTLLETSTDGFFINVGGCFHSVNPALQRLLGASSPEELIGRKVFDFIDPGSHEAVRKRIQAIRASTEPVAPLEEKYLRVDGTQVDVEVTAVAIMESGEHAILVTVRDISERKKAERRRRELEDQLRQAQKMEALGTLAGGIAHDFNNVLAAVTGNAELARLRAGKDSPALPYLQEIMTATQRAKGLTSQVLAFSRQQPPNRRSVDLGAMIESELPLVRAAAPVGVSIEQGLASGPHTVLADPVQIHQVLLNLCNNAWQAFEDAEGRIAVTLRRCVQPDDGNAPADLRHGSYAVLSVSDDGPGIDEGILDRVFEPFFTTKDPGSGTGLGLSVVHSIAKSHDARIVCESEPGQGATFELYLPLVDAPDDGAQEGGRELPRGEGQRILYLDDELALVRVAADLLEDHGYRVAGFTKPDEALAALRAQSGAFDLLVTDLKMPGQTGLDVIQLARAVEPSLPVILVSGYIDDQVLNRAVALRVREVLHKPVDMHTLCRAVADAVA